MPRILLAFVLAGPAALDAARADEYSWELAGVVSELDQPAVVDAETAALQATYYFDPVDDTDGPYALAAFLDPASRVSVRLSREELERPSFGIVGGPTFPGVVTRTDDYTVSGRYVLPRSRWYFGGAYTKSEDEASPPSPLEDPEADRYGVVVGKYLGSRTSLEVAVDFAELHTEQPLTICIPQVFCIVAGTLAVDEERDYASVNAFRVGRLRSMTYSLSGGIDATRGEAVIRVPSVTLPPFIVPVGDITIPPSTTRLSIPRLKRYSVGGELFPTARLGFRVDYSRWDDETPADDAYAVAATWFFRRDVGLQFVYSRQTVDGGGGILFTDADFRYADTATIRVIGRF